MNLIDIWREFLYNINGGSLSDYRVDGDEIYTRNPNEIQKHIGTFENGKSNFSHRRITVSMYWLNRNGFVEAI